MHALPCPQKLRNRKMKAEKKALSSQKGILEKPGAGHKFNQ